MLINLENTGNNIVKKLPVVGGRNDPSFVTGQIGFQPF